MREDALSNEFSRKEIIKHIVHDGLQTFFTPFDLVEKMIPIDLKGTVRVFFNLEFLEVLMSRNYDMKKVQYVGDTEEKVAFSEIYGVESVLIEKEDWDKILKNQKDIKEFFVGCKMNQAADVTFSNPPYNNNLDLKIILALQEAKLLKEFVIVHPATWVVDVKGQISQKINSSMPRKFRHQVKKFISSIELFDPNSIFGEGIFGLSTITQGNFLKLSKSIQDLRNLREVQDIDEITLHGQNWSILKPFIKELKKHESIINKHTTVLNAPKNKFYIQIANIRGTHGLDKDDFFTFVPKKSEIVKGIRKESIPIVFSFDSEKEQNNFLSFLLTDFSRLCLSILKISGGLGRGELALVPWLDFTQSWDDDKLFSFFGYPKGHPIREYAKTFLPDYHKLYTNGKTY